MRTGCWIWKWCPWVWVAVGIRGGEIVRDGGLPGGGSVAVRVVVMGGRRLSVVGGAFAAGLVLVVVVAVTVGPIRAEEAVIKVEADPETVGATQKGRDAVSAESIISPSTGWRAAAVRAQISSALIAGGPGSVLMFARERRSDLVRVTWHSSSRTGPAVEWVFGVSEGHEHGGSSG